MGNLNWFVVRECNKKFVVYKYHNIYAGQTEVNLTQYTTPYDSKIEADGECEKLNSLLK